jgi:hypothetical protein
MLTNDSSSGSPLEETPLVEVWLKIGDSLRLGDRVLRVLDTEGDDTMLRVESVSVGVDDETHWAELPR